MSFVSAISLIVFVIIIYYLVIRFYSVMFRITGITKDKSRFQTVSLLTNAGFTTGESEIITSDKTRRNIAKAAMLTGYFFSVIIVSLFINLFLSIDFSRMSSQVVILAGGMVSLVAFFLFLQLPSVEKALDKAIDSLTEKIYRKVAKENLISVLDTYGEDAVCKVYLYRVPALLDGKTVIDSDIKKLFNLNILMFERSDKVHYVTADTIFSHKDTLLVFGKLDSIRKVFLLKEKNQAKSAGITVEQKTRNEITIIDNYGYQILAEVNVMVVPEILRGKTLIESHIKDYFSINVMMVSRDGNPINLTKDTIIEKGDKVIAFGPLQNIRTVFSQSGDDMSQHL